MRSPRVGHHPRTSTGAWPSYSGVPAPSGVAARAVPIPVASPREPSRRLVQDLLGRVADEDAVQAAPPDGSDDEKIDSVQVDEASDGPSWGPINKVSGLALPDADASECSGEGWS